MARYRFVSDTQNARSAAVADVGSGEGEDGLPDVAFELPDDELPQAAAATVTTLRKTATAVRGSHQLTAWLSAEVLKSRPGIQLVYRLVSLATTR